MKLSKVLSASKINRINWVYSDTGCVSFKSQKKKKKKESLSNNWRDLILPTYLRRMAS